MRLLAPCPLHGTAPQVSGGREGRPIGAYELARAVEELGAGEILLNCIDKDGETDGGREGGGGGELRGE